MPGLRDCPSPPSRKGHLELNAKLLRTPTACESASSCDSIRHSRLESFKSAPLSLSKGGSGELEFAGGDGTANLAAFFGRARDFAALRADRILFSALDDRAEEASVVGCPAQPVQDEFGHGHRVQLLQALAQHPDLTQLLVGEQQFLTPRPRGLDVDGRERAALLQLTVQVQLHVAGALELFVDHVVHPAARVDQGGGGDSQAAALFDLARRAEEALG